MRALTLSLPLLLCLAPPGQTRDILLGRPIACTPGEGCFIDGHVDTDPGPGAADFACGPLSSDRAIGTRFALRSIAEMWAGVDVIAAAPGTVIATRDGMEDIPQDSPDAPAVDGQTCGNGVIVSHGGGWSTQYCHLQNASVAVREGQRVAMGQVLGRVGLSGATDQPHLAFILREGNVPRDPFNPSARIRCDAPPERSLWTDPPPYIPAGLVSVGLSAGMPGLDQIRAGTASPGRLGTDAPGLVVWAQAYGARPGDRLRLTLSGPDGARLIEHDAAVAMDASPRQTLATGLERREPQWPAGRYEVGVTLKRDGVTLERRTQTVTLISP